MHNTVFSPRSAQDPFQVQVLVLGGFSLMSLSSTIEPMRAANRVSGCELYRWRLVSVSGEPPVSSSNLSLPVNGRFEAQTDCDALIIVAAFEPERDGKPALSVLRQMERSSRVAFGGVETGSWVLAAAGLLDGYRATTHWEVIEDFAHRFPEVEVVRDRYVVDQMRFTTGGALPTLDLMLELVRAQHGTKLALDVSSVFIHDEPRQGTDPQHMVSLGHLSRLEPRLETIIRHMETRLDEVQTIKLLADQVGIDPRTLHNLFQRHIRTSPGAYLQDLRMAAARRKLMLTEMSITEIAVSTGFNSASAFARAFRNRFGLSPRELRKSGR